MLKVLGYIALGNVIFIVLIVWSCVKVGADSEKRNVKRGEIK